MTSSVTTRPAETTSGTITSWLPLTTAAPLQAGCSSAIQWRSGFAEAVAFDPGFGITVDEFATCLPPAVTSWWETNEPSLTALRATTRYSIGPLVCPTAYTTAATSVKDARSTQVFCCPSEYDFRTSKLAGVIGQCYSTLTPGQTFTFVDGDFDSTSSVITSTHSVVGVPINGWVFDRKAVKTPSSSNTASSSSNAALPASATSPPLATASATASSLSGGAIAGIAVGATLGVALILGLLAFLFFRRRRRAAAAASGASGKPTDDDTTFPVPEKDGTDVAIARKFDHDTYAAQSNLAAMHGHGHGHASTFSASNASTQLRTPAPPYEGGALLAGGSSLHTPSTGSPGNTYVPGTPYSAELDGRQRAAEMAGHAAPQEMRGDPMRYEMQA